MTVKIGCDDLGCAFSFHLHYANLLIACAARHLPQSRHGRDFIFRFYKQGTDPVFHGRQCPLYLLSGGRPKAWSEKSYFWVLQTEAEKVNRAHTPAASNLIMPYHTGCPTHRIYL
jgi:hypothetical protein